MRTRYPYATIAPPGEPAVPIPVSFEGRLAAPAIAAPMFLVSNPDLVVETCRPALSEPFPRSTSAPRMVTSPGLRKSPIASRAVTGKEAAAPLHSALTSLSTRAIRGSRPTWRSPCGIACRWSSRRLARSRSWSKRSTFMAASCSATSSTCVTPQGSGRRGRGHHCVLRRGRRPPRNPYPVRPAPGTAQVLSQTLVLSGAISTGAHIAAARMLGADLAYLGTRFIATEENSAVPEFKHMILASQAADIVYTAAINGVHGNFLKPSFDACGVEMMWLRPPAPTRSATTATRPGRTSGRLARASVVSRTFPRWPPRARGLCANMRKPWLRRQPT